VPATTESDHRFRVYPNPNKEFSRD
jgi:hypothetical protein